jgi:prepilin-type N-terminal cleavage/methylation domain-containing protein
MICRRTNRGFTLVELMVTVGSITTLSAMLLPAIHSAREASRRSSCQNNVHQTVLALQNFEAQQRHFPVGSRCQRIYPSGLSTIGISWWVEILPYVEQTELRSQLDVSGPYCGWVPLHPRNGHLVDGVGVVPFAVPRRPSLRLPWQRATFESAFRRT